MLALGVASCGDNGGQNGAGASGLEKSKTWSELTTAEKATLCDWEAAKFGGYGLYAHGADARTRSPRA